MVKLKVHNMILIPINLSKKNCMYNILILCIECLCKNKQYTFFKVDTKVNKIKHFRNYLKQ